jgi:phosphoribosylaminoimidazole-succinocarboxamide synthase
MCFECIFNWIVMPAGLCYGVYYFIWLKLAVPLLNISEEISARNKAFDEWATRETANIEDMLNGMEQNMEKENDRLGQRITDIKLEVASLNTLLKGAR